MSERFVVDWQIDEPSERQASRNLGEQADDGVDLLLVERPSVGMARGLSLRSSTTARATTGRGDRVCGH